MPICPVFVFEMLFPVVAHCDGTAAGDCQVALPEASDVKILPTPAPVVTCRFVVFVFPATSSLSPGLEVPIPTLPEFVCIVNPQSAPLSPYNPTVLSSCIPINAGVELFVPPSRETKSLELLFLIRIRESMSSLRWDQKPRYPHYLY